MTLRIFALTVVFAFSGGVATPQSHYKALVQEMQSLEQKVFSTYREYQWLYYLKKQSAQELLAYESLFGVYVNRLREAYETIHLLEQQNLELPRDIVARAYIFRALTFLEKAPLDHSYFERACYDYYEALQLYENTGDVPVIFKPLPFELRLGNRRYFRLIELLQRKGKDLFRFGQIHIILRNFKVTTKFDETSLELLRAADGSGEAPYYTYKLAEGRLRRGFAAALHQAAPVDVHVALPEGIYYVRSRTDVPEDYVNLATLYVRPNEFQTYVVEPIADWVIFYETQEPFASLDGMRPETFVSAMTQDTSEVMEGNQFASTSTDIPAPSPRNENREILRGMESPEAIAPLVESMLETLPLAELEKLPISRSRKEFIKVFSEILARGASASNLSSWNRWTRAWNAASAVTEKFAPGKGVAVEMIKLAHAVIGALQKH